jgi:hypothetical protein
MNPLDLIRRRKAAAKTARVGERAIKRGLAQDLAAAERERAALVNALPLDEEATAAVRGEIGRVGADWRKLHGRELVKGVSGGVDIDPHGAVTVRAAAIPDYFRDLQITFAALAALMPAHLAAGVERLARETDGARVPLRGRIEKIGAVNERIAEITAAQAELTEDEAADDDQAQ